MIEAYKARELTENSGKSIEGSEAGKACFSAIKEAALEGKYIASYICGDDYRLAFDLRDMGKRYGFQSDCGMNKQSQHYVYFGWG